MPEQPQGALEGAAPTENLPGDGHGPQIAAPPRIGNESPVGLATAVGLAPIPLDVADYIRKVLEGDVTTSDQIIAWGVLMLAALGTAWLRQWRARGT